MSTLIVTKTYASDNQPCKGKNCGSTNPAYHSQECYAEHDEATRLPVERLPTNVDSAPTSTGDKP